MFGRHGRLADRFRPVAALLLIAAVGSPALELSGGAPAFSYPDVAGETRSSAEWSGRALIVNFWAPWCAPCRAEIPELVEAAAELEPRGFTVIGVAMDEAAAVRDFLTEVPVNYPVLITGDSSMAFPQRFSEHIYGLPATVFTTDDGRLVWGRAAALSGEEIRAVAERVARVDSGEMSIAEARAEIDSVLAEMAAARLLAKP